MTHRACIHPRRALPTSLTRLGAALLQLAASIAAATAGGADGSGAAIHMRGGARTVLIKSRLMACMAALINKISAQRARAELKRAMQASAPWRGRVLRELGGELGLRRWEARQARALAAKGAAQGFALSHSHNGVAVSAPKCAHSRIICDRYKMDQAGQFRLAAIARPSMQGLRKRRTAHQAQSAWRPLRTIQAARPPFSHHGGEPIPLTPQDLRLRVRRRRAEFNLSHASARPLWPHAYAVGYEPCPHTGKPP